ncbi:MAG TPA: filamentous hemagglutinin N-terminal domain-containing protein [Micropepsaceae bacterium]|nr:filamentous hemagglutinin N-terminal domain-containing protein [Micropepsaceae bacterium]
MRYLNSWAVGVSCLPFLSLPALAAGALPGNGNFVSGAGHISSTATQLTVNQTSKNGIINWGSFSIGAGNAVQINNGSGATLNRVVGSSLSQIDGSLKATGSVYLINQNGIVITPTGQVITGGDFVASTRDTADPGAGNGIVHLSGSSGAGVSNAGTINSGGSAVLVGKSATNTGAVSAPNGIAALVAGDDVTLQPGPGALQIKVKTGSGDATNSGSITAAQAMLNAVGGNVYALGGNITTANATGVGKINGHVWLTAGGSVDVAAPVTASGAVTVNAGGAAYSAVESNGGADGVYINNLVSAAGPISITGSGGNTGVVENYGVMIDSSGVVVTTGGAPISIAGTGGGAGGITFGNDGVFINGPAFNVAPGIVDGSGGPVSITGTGGASFGPNNFGVTNAGGIFNSGNGNITLFGTSGPNGCGAACGSPLGVGEIGVANLGLIRGGTGNIALTGVVSPTVPGNQNFGVGIGGGLVSTSGNGNIEITGTSAGAGGSNSGVLLLDFAAFATGGAISAPPAVTAADGHIRVTGTNSGSDAGFDSGVAIMNGSIATTGRGDVQITGNGGNAGAPGSDTAVAIGGVPGDPASVTAGGKLTVESGDGSVVLLPGGSLTADGNGAALLIRAEHGDFINAGGIVSTPNGKSQIHTGDEANDSDPDQDD